MSSQETRRPLRSSVVTTLASIALAASLAPCGFAGGGASCEYSSTITPYAPGGAFVTFEWGFWYSLCPLRVEPIAVSPGRIDLTVVQLPGGCFFEDHYFCFGPMTTASPVPPGTYDVYSTMIGSTQFMETIVIEPGCTAAGFVPSSGVAGGFDGRIRTALAHAVLPGDAPSLFAAGEFTEVHGGQVNHIAKWDPQSGEWTGVGPIPSPFGGTLGGYAGVDGPVLSPASFNDGMLTDLGDDMPVLYAGGSFTSIDGTPAGRIARWGHFGTWQPLASDFDDGEVRALAVFDDGLGGGPALYAAGTFTSVDGATMNRIARWDGMSWTAVGGGVNDVIDGMAIFDDGNGEALYVGGMFTSAGGAPANRLAKWDGLAWTDIGASLNSPVFVTDVFAVDGIEGEAPSLYITGLLGPWERMARWDGSAWFASGVDHVVTSHAVLDGESGATLFVSGYMPGAFGETYGEDGRLSRWDGAELSVVASWSGRGTTLAVVHDEFADGPSLIAGIDIDGPPTVNAPGFVAPPSIAHRVVRWQDGAWTSLPDRGIEGVVTGVELFDDGQGGGPAVYVAGAISSGGTMLDNSVARWDGQAWVPVGGGIAGARAIRAFDDGSGAGPQLFAGSSRWNGVEWLDDSSFLGTVWALEVVDDGAGKSSLYAVGDFYNIGGLGGCGGWNYGIARWDGSQWCGDVPGIFSWDDFKAVMPTVRAAASFDDSQGGGTQLYVGGEFAIPGVTPGGESTTIARWNGRSWSSVGTVGESISLIQQVRALAVFDAGDGKGEALYAAGPSWTGGSVIVRWDGLAWSQWTPVNEVVFANGDIDMLRVADDGDGPALYVGGTFTTIGVGIGDGVGDGVAANRLARWDGIAWSAVGEGVGDGLSGVREIIETMGEYGPELIVAGGFSSSAFGDAYIATWRGCIDDPGVFGDLNGDGVVDGADLGILLNNWGGDGVGDLNGDGVVDGADLGILLNNWS